MYLGMGIKLEEYLLEQQMELNEVFVRDALINFRGDDLLVYVSRYIASRWYIFCIQN